MNEEFEHEEIQTQAQPQDFESCELCGLRQPEPLINKLYCEKCSTNLQKAYKWLQSPLLPEAEIQSLKQTMYDMTDVQNLHFE